jgi:thioredoxin 1
MLLQATEQNFSQIVFTSQQPVLVHFWAPWCGLCHLIQPLLLQIQKEWREHLQVVTFNADDSLTLANAFRLRSLPTLILFAQGKEIHRFEGITGREEIQKILAQMKVSLVA